MIILVISILLIQGVVALNLESYKVTIDVYSGGMAKVNNDLLFDSNNVKAISIKAFKPTSIIVTDDKEDLNFAVLNDSILIKLKQRNEVHLQYLTTALTSKFLDKWTLRYNIPRKQTENYGGLDKIDFLITLPQTAKIKSHSKEPAISVDKGKLNLEYFLDIEEVDLDIVYELDTIGIQNKTQRKEFIKNISLIALITLIIGAIVLFVVDRYLKSISKGKKEIMKTLEKNENQVIQLLLKNKSQMYQSQIQKQTSISKATLSRVIKRLEQKNIVEVREAGNTNLIVLTDWFRKK